MLVLTLHPIAPAAYYSFDCYSQVAADTLAWTITALLIVVGLGRSGSGATVGAVMLYIPALLFKEQALAAALSAAIVALWFRSSRVARAAVAMVLISAAFAWMRYRAGLWFDVEGPFALCLSCVPANVATLIGGGLLPLPASEVYIAFEEAAWTDPWFMAGAFAVTAAGGLLALGVRKWHLEWRKQAGLVGLLIAATFPVVLLADIGELYAHTLARDVGERARRRWPRARGDAGPSRRSR